MQPESSPHLETDTRFPSGPWTGFFLQKEIPGKHLMELRLTFQMGYMRGEGRDRVGEFLIDGRYDTKDGKCHWTKNYVGKHNVFYQGFNEGKGIWGVWQIDQYQRGGFHIWPEGFGNPTDEYLYEEAEPPVEERELLEAGASSGNGG